MILVVVVKYLLLGSPFHWKGSGVPIMTYFGHRKRSASIPTYHRLFTCFYLSSLPNFGVEWDGGRPAVV